MPVAEESLKRDLKLAQYYNLKRRGFAISHFLNELTIDYGFSAHFQNSEFIGYTALHFAAKFNCTNDIEFLLNRGANPMMKNKNGLTPLHLTVEGKCNNNHNFHGIKSDCKALLSAQLESGDAENPSDKNGLTHFHIACMADHAKAVEFFLKNDISVDETVSSDSPYFPGYTPLHLAAKYSALQAMKILLNHRANTQLKNTKGSTFLHVLLEVITELNRTTSWKPKFHDLVKDATIKMMNFLLLNDSHTIDYTDSTPFYLACSTADTLKAEEILLKITDINQALNAPFCPRYTALHLAACSSIEMVKMLVKNGANILAKGVHDITPLDTCIEKYEIDNIHAALSLDSTWKSILMSDRKTRLLSLILSMRDVNQFDHFLATRKHIANTFVLRDSPIWPGFTVLHVVVMFYRDDEKFEYIIEKFEYIIEKLMANGANINAQDIHGKSPIHLAYERFGRRQITEILMKFIDKIIDVVDEDNLSHLHIACDMGNLEAVEKILPITADVNIAFTGQPDASFVRVGWTPLHCASCGHDIVKLLLLRGANPYLKDAKGMTAIHCSAGSSDTILCLSDLKDDIAKDLGLSHLHIAVYSRNVAAVEKLLNAGANANQALLQKNVLDWLGDSPCNDIGDTPLDFVYGHENTEIIMLLLQHGADILVKESVTVDPEVSDYLKPIVTSLTRNSNLFKRLENEIGLTMLHVACFKKDVNLVHELVENGADVNAQINVKSRLWPGFTPLHVIMDVEDHNQSLDEIVRLLLDNGADTTLTNFDVEKTALYLAYDKIPENSPSNRYSCLKIILRAHKDFTINPTRKDGLSYFHVACEIGDIISANKFLKHGANVNQPTDFFNERLFFRNKHHNTGGCTPLHLAAASSKHAMDPMTQLELIDLLLNYGANVNAEDVHGNTPLYFMTKWNCKREDIVLRLIESGANVNFRNVQDETLLELQLKVDNSTSIDGIRWFLKMGCIFNSFNSVTDKGLIASVLSLIATEDRVYLVKSSMLNFPNLMQKDKMNRTVIHNIVSNTNQTSKGSSVISDIQYLKLLGVVVKIKRFNYDIDDRDTLGRTPLHLAVLFRNTQAITGLLMAGADVNVIDMNGKTAFSYIFESCIRCSSQETRKANHNQFDHYEIFFIFVNHMNKLLFCGLDVNQTNVDLMFQAFQKFNYRDMILKKSFEDEIKKVKDIKIPQTRLLVGNFLSETDAIITYLTLPQTERDAVDEFFNNAADNIQAKFVQANDIIVLQYRKAVKRMELNESAKNTLNTLAGFVVPDLCSTAILKLLSNSELNSMIEATV